MALNYFICNINQERVEDKIKISTPTKSIDCVVVIFIKSTRSWELWVMDSPSCLILVESSTIFPIIFVARFLSFSSINSRFPSLAFLITYSKISPLIYDLYSNCLSSCSSTFIKTWACSTSLIINVHKSNFF